MERTVSGTRRVAVSPTAADTWHVFDHERRLLATFQDYDHAEDYARELGWATGEAPRHRVSEPHHSVNPILDALEAWRRAEAVAEAQDPGCDPLEREQAREAVRRARKQWEQTVLDDRRRVF